MIEKEYKASKFALLSITGSVVILLLIAILMYSKRGWSALLLSPLILVFIGFIRFLKLYRQPQFKISDKELNIINPPKKIEMAKIVSVKSEGKDKLELIMKDEIPVPLFLKDLSSKDRVDLELTIKQAIGRKS